MRVRFPTPDLSRVSMRVTFAVWRPCTKVACTVALVVGIGGCASHPKPGAEPSLGLSTADASSRSENLKPAEAVLRTPELTVTRAPWQYGDAVGSLITTP